MEYILDGTLCETRWILFQKQPLYTLSFFFLLFLFRRSGCQLPLSPFSLVGHGCGSLKRVGYVCQAACPRQGGHEHPIPPIIVHTSSTLYLLQRVTDVMSASRFLLLPAEIKYRVYSFCTPIFAYAEEFNGLSLTCWQVRHEYESEATRVMRQALSDMKRQSTFPAEIRFSEIRTIGDIARIAVLLPVSEYFPRNRGDWSKIDSFDNTKLDPCLAPLYSLYLSRLVFKFYVNTDNFVNWSPEVIPTGLLHDMMDPLNGLPFESDVPPDDDVMVRGFRVDEPVRIRRLEYNWFNSKVTHSSNLNSLVQADAETSNFFLHISRHFQRPLGLVHNWGRQADTLWFDLVYT